MLNTIITYPLQIGEISYLPGDAFDVERALKSGDISERLLAQLGEQNKIGKATPDTFRVAAARRPAGSPWPPRGFTEAYLIDQGLIDQEEVPKSPPKRAKGKPGGQPAVMITDVQLTDEAIQVGAYFLQPKRRGNFVFYDAVSSTGKLMRDKSFRTVEAGTEFLNSLSGGAQDQPEAKADDGDVRPGAGGPEGPDSPEDR